MKIAVITGASRGLGKSMAEHLGTRGVGVIGTYRRSDGAAGPTMLQLDVADMQSIDAFAAALPKALEKNFGRKTFDYLVNNAGVGLHAPIAQTTEAQFDEMVNVHLKAPFFLTQKLLPLIEDGGRILNMSSGLARFTIPGSSAYAAMKGGVEVLTRYMAKEFGERKIRANVIAPGAIATDFSGGMVRDNPELNKMIAGNTALGRVGHADDIGRAVAALLSDDCEWLNGTRVEVSGGQSL